MKTFDLEIVTPEAAIFSGQVQSVQVPGVMGSFQVLRDHAPIISALGDGMVKLVKEDGQEQEYHAQSGVIEVQKNKAIVLIERIIES